FIRKPPIKHNPQHYEPEDAAEPVKLALGGVELVYEDREWRAAAGVAGGGGSQAAAAAAELSQMNERLEAENQLLKLKLAVALEMLAAAKLDVLTLQQESKSYS
ncbi:hypothetical protein HK405_002987, partial [Cladochytrium tenue]